MTCVIQDRRKRAITLETPEQSNVGLEYTWYFSVFFFALCTVVLLRVGVYFYRKRTAAGSIVLKDEEAPKDKQCIGQCRAPM